MIESYFWIIYISTPLLITFMLRVANERLFKISIISFTVLSLYVFSVVGTLPLFYQWDDTRVNFGVTNPAIVLNVLIFSSINIQFFLVGVIIEKKISSNGLLPFDSIFGLSPLSRMQYIVLFIALVISFSMFLDYLSKINELAILKAILVGANEASVTRSEMGNDFSGKYHWYRFFMYSVSQLATYVLFANWIQKRGVLNFIVFLLVFIFSAFVAISAIEKAPLVWILVGVYLTYAIVAKNGILELRKIVPLLLMLTVVMILMYQYFMGAENVVDAFSRFISRAFAGSIEPAYFYLEYFPAVEDYLHGATFPNPGGLLPFTPVRYTVDIANWVIPSLASRGIVGSMPTVFWGESYANFGPIGVPIIAFFMGYLISKLNSYVLIIKSNVVVVGFYVWMVLDIRAISEAGFSSYVFNFSLILMLILVALLLSFGKRIPIRKCLRSTSL